MKFTKAIDIWSLSQKGDKLAVRDPVHSNGKIVGYNEILLDNLQQAVRFVNERS